MNKEKDKNITDISARIAEIIEKGGYNPNSFAKELGYNRAQTIYDLISSKCAPSYDFFKRLAMSDISATLDLRWLIAGKASIQQETKDKELTYLIDKIIEQAEEIGKLRHQLSLIKGEGATAKQ